MDKNEQYCKNCGGTPVILIEELPSRPPLSSYESNIAVVILGIASMALVVVGSSMPWTIVSGVSKSGTEGYRIIALIGAIVVGIFFALTLFPGRQIWPCAVSFFLCFIPATVFIYIIAGMQKYYITYDVGLGMYLGIIGTGAGLLFSLFGSKIYEYL